MNPRRAAIVDHGSTDSGTDELVGLAGAMTIKITDGKHSYSSTTRGRSSLKNAGEGPDVRVQDIEACTSGAKASVKCTLSQR